MLFYYIFQICIFDVANGAETCLKNMWLAGQLVFCNSKKSDFTMPPFVKEPFSSDAGQAYCSFW